MLLLLDFFFIRIGWVATVCMFSAGSNSEQNGMDRLICKYERFNKNDERRGIQYTRRLVTFEMRTCSSSLLIHWVYLVFDSVVHFDLSGDCDCDDVGRIMYVCCETIDGEFHAYVCVVNDATIRRHSKSTIQVLNNSLIRRVNNCLCIQCTCIYYSYTPVVFRLWRKACMRCACNLYCKMLGKRKNVTSLKMYVTAHIQMQIEFDALLNITNYRTQDTSRV